MSTGPSLPLIVALVTSTGLLATNEAIRQGQTKERKEEHRGRRCNLTVSCNAPSARRREIHQQQVVLRDSKLYVNTYLRADETNSQGQDSETTGSSHGHPFTGYYLPYPDTKYEGLVSSIADTDPPVMNWIYVDRDTYEVKYGVRVDAQPHITGPFDCTKQDHRLTLHGWEGFAAVDEGDGKWGLYFDFDDDGLRRKLGPQRMVLDVQLMRTEKKVAKPA